MRELDDADSGVEASAPVNGQVLIAELQRQDDGRHDPQQLRLQHPLPTVLQQHDHQHDRDHEQRDQFFRRHVVSPQRPDAASPETALSTLAASIRAG